MAEAGLASDPVCGMPVEVDLAPGKSIFEGDTYVFCSVGCKEAFDADPIPYRAGTATPPRLRDRRPIRKHVMICAGGDCSKRGQDAEKMRRGFRRTLFRLNRLHGGTLPGDIRVATTSCIGGCGNGPMVAIYPEGVFYSNVSLSDVDRVIEDHLLNDRVVPDLYFFQTLPPSELSDVPDRSGETSPKAPAEDCQATD